MVLALESPFVRYCFFLLAGVTLVFQIAAEDVSIFRARAHRSLYGEAALFSSGSCYGVP